MTKERIRILVDTSRDTGWSNGLIHIEPDNIYQTTNNRDYLNEAVLKNYDVLTICSNTSLKYTDAELQLIREFVENGGGLLLASNTSRFERDVCESISELGVNHVASLFEARFLLLPEGHREMGINENPSRIPHGQGEIDIDASPLRSYTRKNLRLTDSEIVDGLGIDDLGLMHCGVLDIPADSSVFLEHIETEDPVGACLHFGSGRVLLINAQLFSGENHLISGRFIDWLGINRVSLTTGAQAIPDEIPIEEQVKEDGKIKILYTHFVEDRVDTCMTFAKKLQKEMLAKFPEGEKIEWKISLIPSDLIPSATTEYWLGSSMSVGACVSPPRLAYAFGFEASGLLVSKTPFEKAAYVMSEGFQFFFGIWAMKLLGFEREAAEILSEFERRFQENTEAERLIDLTKVYDQPSHKRTWTLKALLEKYGDDLFIRFAEMVSETEGPPDKNMPLTTFSWVDVLIYYLSRVVGEDLFPWFEEIGTTVHPLPLLPNDSDEFVTEVRERLNGIIRDRTADTSDRTEAIESLLRIADESEHGIPASVTQLDAVDRYQRLIAAAKLLKGYDDRAVKVLEALTLETGDDGLVAIAVLMLIRSDRAVGMLDRLVEIAPHQDYRYQIEAGYLLKKMDHPAAERFSHERIVDENGTPVITIEVEHNRGLHLNAIVEGHRVAIYRADPCMHHFPYNTHVPGVYIGWLHTVPNYRRRGLSQWICDASMSHELVHRYSCISLITGTDNTAHAIYRDFGFVDCLLEQAFTKTLQHEPTQEVEGLVIRPYSHGDEVAMAKVSNAFHEDQMERRRRRAVRRRISETWLIYLAEKDGELLGYLQVGCSDNGKFAWISEFCLKPQPSEDESLLEEVGAALLGALHDKLVKREYEQISWSSQGEAEKNYVRKLFHNLGYTSVATNWVWMFRIINLPMLLGELSPLLSKRLSESDAYKNWQGTIGIKSSEHQASLIISDGEIRVSTEVPEESAIHLSTDDDTLTQFIWGVLTPYEAYLQSQLHVAPSVNRSVAGLLETLFPARQQVEDRGPQWLPSRLYHI